jgi:hypothetical protein
LRSAGRQLDAHGLGAGLEADGRAEPIARAVVALTEAGFDTGAIERSVREEVEAAATAALEEQVAGENYRRVPRHIDDPDF